MDITSPKIYESARLQIKHLYEEWIVKTAYSILKPKVKTYAQKLGVDAPETLVKSNLKSRWASLTRKGSINFNLHLIKAPQEVIDYIALHEICHLKIKGHSYHYWDLVYRYMPNYQEKIDWLSVNGKWLINNNKAR